MMKVSILVPVYKVENFISKCACSLFEQTYENIEYVFVDDCSPDKSIQILKEMLLHYPNRQFQVKIVTHSVNRGLAAARNTALKHATGKYVLNVDSDDYLEHDAIRLLYEKAEKEEADVVVFDSYIDCLGKRRKLREIFVGNKVEYIKKVLQLEVTPSTCSRFLKRDLYIKSEIRAIDGVNQGEDLSVIPRLLYSANRIVKLDEYLYNYVQYNTSSYTNNVTKKALSNMIQVCDMLSIFFNGVNDADLYSKSLLIMKLRVKIYLLKHIDKDNLPEVSNLFLDIEQKHRSFLMFHEQVMLLISRYKFYCLLRLYTDIGILFRKYLRIILGD